MLTTRTICPARHTHLSDVILTECTTAPPTPRPSPTPGGGCAKNKIASAVTRPSRKVVPGRAFTYVVPRRAGCLAGRGIDISPATWKD
jgi:hypothetical protein